MIFGNLFPKTTSRKRRAFRLAQDGHIRYNTRVLYALPFPKGERPLDQREEGMNVRHYEMLVLVSAELEDPKEEIGKIEDVVRNLGGEVGETDVWGKRRLAYPIQKKNEGVYALLDFRLEPAQTFELKRVLGLRANVYRQMIIALDE
jgi:small subunit ribosomal protein S6